MTQHYSDPSRESDPHALPNIEVFHMTPKEAEAFFGDSEAQPGWYWWACFPGCLPDAEPSGPFETSAEALADAQRD